MHLHSESLRPPSRFVFGLLPLLLLIGLLLVLLVQFL